MNLKTQLEIHVLNREGVISILQLVRWKNIGIVIMQPENACDQYARWFGPWLSSPCLKDSMDVTMLFEDSILMFAPLVLGSLVLLVQLAAKIWSKPDRKIHRLGGWLWVLKLVRPDIIGLGD